MANAARRVHVVRTVFDEETGEVLGYDRIEARALLDDLEAALFRFGGMVNIAARRVQVDEALGEPVALSTELVLTWDSYAPLERIDDGPEEDAPPADADHPLVAGDEDDTRTAEEIAAEYGAEPVAETA